MAPSSLPKQTTHLHPLLRNLRLRDLEIFVLAARLGSIRLAAREFRFEPSQVSRTIQMIERSIGERLFQRATTGISLTPSGQRIYEVALTLLSQTRFLRGDAGKGTGKATFYGLASANYLVQNLLPECLADLGKSQPGVGLRVIELYPDQMLLPAMKGAFDIAVHAGEISWPTSWLSEKVGLIEWGFYARAEHPLFRIKREKHRKSFSVENLTEFPFLLPFDFSQDDGFRFRDDRSPIPLHLRKHGIEMQRADVATALLVRTDHLAHLPSIVTYRLVSEGKLRKLTLNNVPPVESSLFLSVQTFNVAAQALQIMKKSLARQLAECEAIQKANR